MCSCLRVASGRFWPRRWRAARRRRATRAAPAWRYRWRTSRQAASPLPFGAPLRLCHVSTRLLTQRRRLPPGSQALEPLSEAEALPWLKGARKRRQRTTHPLRAGKHSADAAPRAARAEMHLQSEAENAAYAAARKARRPRLCLSLARAHTHVC